MKRPVFFRNIVSIGLSDQLSTRDTGSVVLSNLIAWIGVFVLSISLVIDLFMKEWESFYYDLILTILLAATFALNFYKVYKLAQFYITIIILLGIIFGSIIFRDQYFFKYLVIVPISLGFIFSRSGNKWILYISGFITFFYIIISEFYKFNPTDTTSHNSFLDQYSTTIGYLSFVLCYFLIQWYFSLNLNKVEKELSESEAKLRAENNAKNKFLSIISHDLRTPFHSIIGFSDLIDSKAMKLEKVLELNQHINVVSKNTLRLLDNLLEWGRLQEGNLKYDPEKLDLNTLLKENYDNSLCIARVKNIHFELELSEDCSIYADKYMINTVIRNLISNAIKYSFENSTIKISSKKESRYCLFRIKDQGLGMDETTISNLFKIELSQSLPGTNKERGTGLGLIICKEFIEKNNGIITVKSELEKGTEFTVELPAQLL